MTAGQTDADLHIIQRNECKSPRRRIRAGHRSFTIKTMDWYQIGFWIGLAVTATGFVVLALAGMSFRLRAYRNLPAWDGATRPLLKWGLLILFIGLLVFAPMLYHLYTAAS